MVVGRQLVRVVSLLAVSVIVLSGCGSVEEPDLDLPIPHVEILRGPARLTNDRAAMFEFECDVDSCSTECDFDARGWAACESPVLHEDLRDGEHLFRVRGYNAKGEAGQPSEWRWTLDTSLPRVVDLEGPESFTAETTASFSFGCSKQACSFECSLSGGLPWPCEPGESIEDLADATYELRVRAVDPAGNVGEEAIWTWTVDTLVPEVTINEGPAPLTAETSATFAFECSKEHCRFECALDQGDFDDCRSGDVYGGTFEQDRLGDGSHVFTVRAIDPRVGLVGPAASWTWTIDTEEPVVTDLVGPPRHTNSTAASFSFACSKELCEFSCELTGASQGPIGEPESCSPGVAYEALDDDTYTLVVTARDEALNSSSASHTWTVDTLLPVVTITGSAEAVTRESSVQFEFDCTNKMGCTFECALERVGPDGGWQVGDWQRCASPQLLEDLKAGRHVYKVRATDRAGNVGHAEHEWTLELHILMSVPGPLSWQTSATIDFACNSFTCEYACELAYRSDEGEVEDVTWSDCTSPLVLEDLVEGEYVVRVEATDVEGDLASIERGWRMQRRFHPRVSGGDEFACALARDDTMWCWGRNEFGQLGDGTLIDRSRPVMLGADADWVEVTAGYDHACGLRRDASLWCWGRNQYGYLGDGTLEDRRAPVQVASRKDWGLISSGAQHMCAIAQDGTLWCWGRNNVGQVGDGSQETQTSPLQIGEDDDWVHVSSGGMHTCAVKHDGTLWCWGYNQYGQVGDGGTAHRLEPVRAGLESDWAQAAAGMDHSCAIKRDGTLWCFGRNVYGQLGDGNNQNKYAPVKIGTDSDWLRVEATEHTCGVRADGSLWCWGYNRYGQVGNASTQNQSTPFRVLESVDWIEKSVSRHNTCGFAADASLWCWGDNSRGQIGDGGGGARTSPVLVWDNEF